MPTPYDATNPQIRTSMGSAKYAPEKDAILWKIKSFPGNKVGHLQYKCSSLVRLELSFYFELFGCNVFRNVC